MRQSSGALNGQLLSHNAAVEDSGELASPFLANPADPSPTGSSAPIRPAPRTAAAQSRNAILAIGLEMQLLGLPRVQFDSAADQTYVVLHELHDTVTCSLENFHSSALSDTKQLVAEMLREESTELASAFAVNLHLQADGASDLQPRQLATALADWVQKTTLAETQRLATDLARRLHQELIPVRQRLDESLAAAAATAEVAILNATGARPPMPTWQTDAWPPPLDAHVEVESAPSSRQLHPKPARLLPAAAARHLILSRAEGALQTTFAARVRDVSDEFEHHVNESAHQYEQRTNATLAKTEQTIAAIIERVRRTRNEPRAQRRNRLHTLAGERTRLWQLATTDPETPEPATQSSPLASRARSTSELQPKPEAMQ